jgi:hypothetical protein
MNRIWCTLCCTKVNNDSPYRAFNAAKRHFVQYHDTDPDFSAAIVMDTLGETKDSVEQVRRALIRKFITEKATHSLFSATQSSGSVTIEGMSFDKTPETDIPPAVMNEYRKYHRRIKQKKKANRRQNRKHEKRYSIR